MFRKEFPVIYEIIFNQISDRDSENVYGRNFESGVRNHPLFRRRCDRIEKALQSLDSDSKRLLKNKVCPYLTTKQAGRGWHQLFDTLNEALAYNYLKSLGCSNIHLIPESSGTPDIEGVLPSGKVLLEVKTINISKEEAEIRASDQPVWQDVQYQLEEGFFNKLKKTIEKAKNQLIRYDQAEHNIVYIFINFDDSLGEYKDRYFQQMDRFFAENMVTGIELVLHNQETPFHKPIIMKFATIVND